MSDQVPLVRMVVDKERCIGGAQCELLAPDVFTVDDAAMSSVIEPGLLPRALADKVVDRCPGRAISVVDAADAEEAS